MSSPLEANVTAAENFFDLLGRKFKPGLYRLRLQRIVETDTVDSFTSWVRADNLESIWDVALACGRKWADCEPSGEGIIVYITNDNVNYSVLWGILPTGQKVRLNYFLKRILVPLF